MRLVCDNSHSKVLVQLEAGKSPDILSVNIILALYVGDLVTHVLVAKCDKLNTSSY